MREGLLDWWPSQVGGTVGGENGTESSAGAGALGARRRRIGQINENLVLCARGGHFVQQFISARQGRATIKLPSGEKGAEASPAAGAAEGEVSGEGLSEELLRLARIARASARAGSSAMLSGSNQRHRSR